MIFIVGLGNPGKDYAQTRHNAGFLFVDYLRDFASKKDNSLWPEFTLDAKKSAEVCKHNQIVLVKPQTYMNGSGQAVQAVMRFYDKENLPSSQNQALRNVVVCHDDLDIELGKIKLQFGTGPKVHNGLISLSQHLKTDLFWHLRIGVDARQGVRTLTGAEYVLQSFLPAEMELLKAQFTQIASQMYDQFLRPGG